MHTGYMHVYIYQCIHTACMDMYDILCTALDIIMWYNKLYMHWICMWYIAWKSRTWTRKWTRTPDMDMHGHGRRSTVEKRSTIDFIDDHYQQVEYLIQCKAACNGIEGQALAFR